MSAKSSPYQFEGIPPASSSSGNGNGDDAQQQPSGLGARRGGGSSSPPRHHGAGATGSSKQRRHSPKHHLKHRGLAKGDGRGSRGATAGGPASFLASIDGLITESDRQSKLRMGVKLLTLVAFSPFFLVKFIIDRMASANDAILNYLPGIVDAIYTYLVLPASRAFNAAVVRPALAVARWWWRLLVPPATAAWAWCWGGLCALLGWGWDHACGLYAFLRYRMVPEAWRLVSQVYAPWLHRTLIRPAWQASWSAAGWAYGVVKAWVVLPIYTPVHDATVRLIGHVQAQLQRGAAAVVGACVASRDYARDAAEVARLCFGMLVLGRPADDKEA